MERLESYSADLCGVKLELYACEGIFSRRRMDPGSSLLLESFLETSRHRRTPVRGLLDLGCGNGVVGIGTLLNLEGATCCFTDINASALVCCRLNLERHGLLERSVVCRGWGTEHLRSSSFDTVLFNPPVRAGWSAVFPMLAGLLRVLTEGGRLFIVGRRRQGVLSMVRHMEENGYVTVERLSRRGGYEVWSGRRPSEVLTDGKGAPS